MTTAISKGGVIASTKKGTDARIAGIMFTSAGIIFLILTTASEAIYPNFSLQTNSISDMAAIGTQTTAIEEVAILGLAIPWIVGAFYLFRNTGKKSLMFLNLLPGIGAFLAALSPENVNIAIHSVGALLAFPFGAIAAILSYRMIHSPFKYFSVGLGALSLIATLVTFLGQWIIGPCGTCVGNTPGYVQSLNKLLLGLGGWESMIIYPLIIWLIGFGNYLLGLRKAENV